MQIRFMRWIIWFLAISFYFYEYLLRVCPSVMVQDLMLDFGVSAGALGVLSAFYLYGYAPMQLPAGMLMDRFGARNLLTIATGICSFGTLIFGLTNALWLAQLGRLLIGGGAAFAFVGMVYITSHWFTKKKLALLVGVGNSIGMLGAVAGEGPFSTVVSFFGWREATLFLAAAGFLLTLVIFMCIRNEPASMSKRNNQPKRLHAHLFDNIKVVIKNGQTWVNCLIALLFYASTVAFAGLWVVPFLEASYGLSKELAGYGGSIIYLGWIVGGPLIGLGSDRMGKRKPMLILFSLLALLFMVVLLYAPELQLPLIYALCFGLGICLSAQLLCYSLAVELNPDEVKGTSLAITNFTVFVGGAIVQTLVGIILDLEWHGTFLGDLPYYTRADYSIALVCFPITLLLSAIVSLFLLEFKIKHTVKIRRSR